MNKQTMAEPNQYTDYYPFGLAHTTHVHGFSPTGTNRYLYNGKLLQDDAYVTSDTEPTYQLNWYDYGARMYDPAVGRFHSIDPLAPIYGSQSPYICAGNSPVTFIDYMGLGSQDKKDHYAWYNPNPGKSNNNGSTGSIFSDWVYSVTEHLGFTREDMGSANSNTELDRAAAYNQQQTQRAVQTAKNVNTTTAVVGGTAVLAPLTIYGLTSVTGGAIISKEVFAYKAAGSIIYQMALNKGDIDVLGVYADAALCPFANAFLSGVCNISYNPITRKGRIKILGLSKNPDEAMIDFSTSLMPGLLGDRSWKGLKSTGFFDKLDKRIINYAEGYNARFFIAVDKSSNKMLNIMLYEGEK